MTAFNQTGTGTGPLFELVEAVPVPVLRFSIEAVPVPVPVPRF